VKECRIIAAVLDFIHQVAVVSGPAKILCEYSIKRVQRQIKAGLRAKGGRETIQIFTMK